MFSLAGTDEAWTKHHASGSFPSLKIQKFGIQQIKKIKKSSKSNSVLPKMSARSGLVGKNPPGTIWGHPRPFFPWTEKIKKQIQILPIFLGGPMGPIFRCGPLLLSTRGGGIGNGHRLLAMLACFPWLGPMKPERSIMPQDLFQAWKSRNLGSNKSKK